ncbi:MAG TPA: hypothetical protein VKZ59_02650 [Acidobacteriota bacterium]|nr:hypothetical protein [Acidobacteriota bacterium]
MVAANLFDQPLQAVGDGKSDKLAVDPFLIVIEMLAATSEHGIDNITPLTT